MNEDPVDIDLVETWPAPLLAWARVAVDDRADAIREGHISRFAEQDALVWRHIGARGVRAYHCTRLLPHEIVDIRRDGLVPLSDALVEKRIRSAVLHGHLSHDEADRGHARWSELRASQGDHREGLVWAVAGRGVLNRQAEGLVVFLRSWGSESIFGGPIDGPGAIAIGTPAVVVTTVRLADYLNPPGGSVAWAFAAAVSADVIPGWRGAEFSIRGAVREVTDV